jgi:hypothetical protein
MIKDIKNKHFNIVGDKNYVMVSSNNKFGSKRLANSLEIDCNNSSLLSGM